VFRPGKCSGTYFGRVVGNRLFDTRAKRAIALDELWNARRKPEHVLEHQNLSIAGNAGSDTDGRDRHRSRKLSRERFRDCFYRPLLSSTENFERWKKLGERDAAARAGEIWRKTLEEYEQPPLDDGIRTSLGEYVVRRRAELGD